VLITSEEVTVTAANTPLHSEQQLQQLEQAQDDASATVKSHISFSNSSSTDNAATMHRDDSNGTVADTDDIDIDETELDSVEDEEAEPVYLTVGDYFGEDAIINPTERTATYKVHIMHVCMHLLLV
jgi:hypothetical protein